MTCRSPRSVLCVLAAGCLAAWACAGLAAETAIRTSQDNTSVSVFAGERPLLQYRHGEGLFKPYVVQLYSPGGVQVLRDAPADHKHHHALMFAIGVDGVDFWSENPKCGRQKGHAPDSVKATTHNGIARAEFTQQLQWVGPAGENPLMIEQRKIEVSPLRGVPEAERDFRGAKGDSGVGPAVTLVTWRSRLQAPPGKDAVKLYGSHYFGLGMRFVASMDKCGRFFVPDGKELGDKVRGSERLTPARWCAYTASADGKPVTVAVFDHPGNVRHPARMFTMCPFAYLSATLNLWKEPLMLQADKPLDLCYGVAVWDGEIDAAAVEKTYQRWIATKQ